MKRRPLLPKTLCIGPGGFKCACCFPAPGSKTRRKAFKVARRKEAREHLKREFNLMDLT